MKSSVNNLIRISQNIAKSNEMRDSKRAALLAMMDRELSTPNDSYGLRHEQIKENGLQTECPHHCPQQTDSRQQANSEYVSQYYARSEDNQKIHRSELYTIDKTIRRFMRENGHHDDDNDSSMASDHLMSDSDDTTSSEDTRPIVPDRINKPDVSLKNKILKTINKSLLSAELTGIDLNVLKFNDSIRKTLKKIERSNLERELNMDLVRSFSYGHLADLRREDIKYVNLMNGGSGRACSKNKTNSSGNQNASFYYTTEDVADLHMPRQLETYKIKMAVEKDKLSRSK
jgi:hypothetical protein